MHEDRIDADRARVESEPIDPEDAKWQTRLLSFVLSEHPKQLITTDLARELLSDAPTRAERNGLEGALRTLQFAGLLSCFEGVVKPTEPALHFYNLELE